MNTLAYVNILCLVMLASTVNYSFAQSGSEQTTLPEDLAIVSINRSTNGISTGAVYIFDANYTLIRILDSTEKQVPGQFSGDVLYKNGKLILLTPSRVNDPTKSDIGPVKMEGAISIFDGMTGSLIKTIPNPQPNTVKDYVGGTFGSSVAYVGDEIAVGNPNRDINGVYAAGAVYLYDDAGNLALTIANPDPADSDNFGSSVVSWGDKIAIGVSNKANGNNAAAGEVEIFDANSGNLLKTIKNPNPTAYAGFGYIMDISENKLLITAPTAHVDGDENVGEAYLFDANSGNLLKTIKNPNPDDGDMFGRSAMFAGDKIVIGAIGDGVFDEGSVYVFDLDGKLLNTIHSPQKTPKSGFYSNEFGISLAVTGNRLAVGDDSKMTNNVRIGGAYVFDINTGELLQTIDNPVSSSDAFGYFLEFVGNMEPSASSIAMIKLQSAPVQESQINKDSPDEVWIEPQLDTVSSFVGTLQYAKIPENFKCDIIPKINYHYVKKNQHAQYPEYDSLFMRIGGEDTVQDYQMVIGLWNEKDNAYAKDLSYHIILKNPDGADKMSAIYSPDAYSDYSILGVAVEANNKANKDGIVPSDVEKKFTELFGSSYVLPIGISSNGNYQLYARVFDSQDDWINADTCGIQAIIPVTVNGHDDVTVGKIQFSNILVSAIDTNKENLETAKKIVNDTVQRRDNQETQSDQKENIKNISRSQYMSPRKQIESGIQTDKITCKQNLVLIQKYDYSPVCVKPETKQKLIERGWVMPDDFDHSAMLERGNVAMGFDQNKIRHHFMSTMTGGKIMVMSKNMSDIQTINEIKDHIKTIQYEFSQGNFTNPFYIHAQVVPGTDIMTTKRNLIQYKIQDIDGGSSLILTTNDTELINAIQQFMDFQSSQHVGH